MGLRTAESPFTIRVLACGLIDIIRWLLYRCAFHFTLTYRRISMASPSRQVPYTGLSRSRRSSLSIHASHTLMQLNRHRWIPRYMRRHAPVATAFTIITALFLDEL
jgi:hypothetical protein